MESVQRRKRILIVDDERALADTLAAFFTHVGYEVQVAYNGEQALEEFHAHQFDAIISDIVMPGMNGMQLLNRIRAENGEVPVLIVSGFCDRYAAELAERVSKEITHFAQKPVGLQSFVRLLADLIERAETKSSSTESLSERKTDILGH